MVAARRRRRVTHGVAGTLSDQKSSVGVVWLTGRAITRVLGLLPAPATRGWACCIGRLQGPAF
jgi:hypothetical protein